MQRSSYMLGTAAGSASSCRRFFSSGGSGQRPIFVAATKQHVGKTTTSLALMAGLQKRFPKVGFIKPVGQQHVTVHSDSKFTLMLLRYHL
mmetsp:Transcript_11265/g.16146  ORF Transcript_11265/g.16146 Transcript_11265/m.16146 type:complete len:90 (+) Transcript_11265:69-338(+)